jgi:amidase
VSELFRLSASAAARGIADGKFSSVELIESCLERIALREPDVRAWTSIDPQLSLGEARTRDRSAPAGPLHGVPVGVKDIIDTRDFPTEYGSPIFRGHRPQRDAVCVERLRAAGAVILGKTVTTEFAFFQPGKTRNPHNLAHTPGGSSSGSAAAVADYHVPLALGTQTAGSVIRPASFNGVIGYKPSFGAIPTTGVFEFAASLDTVGAFARSFDDLALLGVTSSSSEQTLERAPRIGFVRMPYWLEAEDELRRCLETATAELRTAGALVEDIELSATFSDLIDAHRTVMIAEGTAALAETHASHGDRLSDHLCRMIEEGRGLGADRIAEAGAVRARCLSEIDGLWQRVDVLLTPGACGVAPCGHASTGDPLFNRSWTFLHLPAVGFPIGRGGDGLPLGAQVIAPFAADARAIAAARWIHAEVGGIIGVDLSQT